MFAMVMVRIASAVVAEDKVVFGFEAREIEWPSGVKGGRFCVHGGCSRGG